MQGTIHPSTPVHPYYRSSHCRIEFSDLMPFSSSQPHHHWTNPDHQGTSHYPHTARKSHKTIPQAKPHERKPSQQERGGSQQRIQCSFPCIHSTKMPRSKSLDSGQFWHGRCSRSRGWKLPSRAERYPSRFEHRWLRDRSCQGGSCRLLTSRLRVQESSPLEQHQNSPLGEQSGKHRG